VKWAESNGGVAPPARCRPPSRLGTRLRTRTLEESDRRRDQQGLSSPRRPPDGFTNTLVTTNKGKANRARPVHSRRTCEGRHQGQSQAFDSATSTCSVVGVTANVHKNSTACRRGWGPDWPARPASTRNIVARGDPAAGQLQLIGVRQTL